MAQGNICFLWTRPIALTDPALAQMCGVTQPGDRDGVHLERCCVERALTRAEGQSKQDKWKFQRATETSYCLLGRDTPCSPRFRR